MEINHLTSERLSLVDLAAVDKLELDGVLFIYLWGSLWQQWQRWKRPHCWRWALENLSLTATERKLTKTKGGPVPSRRTCARVFHYTILKTTTMRNLESVWHRQFPAELGKSTGSRECFVRRSLAATAAGTVTEKGNLTR